MNTPDNRTIHVFNGGMQAIQRCADAIASKLVTSLFNCDDRLHWLDDAGKLTPVSTRLLADLVDRHLVSVRLAARDDGSQHVVEYRPLALGQQDLVDVLNSLVKLVAIGPSKPRLLSEQQRGHIRDRLKQGEPKEMVAEAYGVDLATVRAIMVAAAA
jgi:hypothetical protein